MKLNAHRKSIVARQLHGSPYHYHYQRIFNRRLVLIAPAGGGTRRIGRVCSLTISRDPGARLSFGAGNLSVFLSMST